MRNRLSLVFLIATLVACSGPAVIPVSDLSGANNSDKARVVAEGDSLYQISWEAGLDYRDVARWNNLEPPYRLSTGQMIYFSDQSLSDNVSPVASSPQPVVVEVTPIISPAETESSADSRTVDNNATVPMASIETGHGWVWPADGIVIGRFEDNTGDNGIDISGQSGDPIQAAAGGKVVYAGTGLRGYGLLLILKHDETYLSAYAHNRAVMAKEGDEVGKGQVIAEMGQTGAESPRLHFEIRKDGKPVDPLRYLPQKN
ncbi:peptidoglycan DD-metalloendopeptidase family protein [Arenicellales bacterium nBUS_48]